MLVGDSLGNTALGLPSTIEVTLEMMIHHCAAVSRGVQRALLIGDMPFMTYKVSAEQALVNCGRLIQEGHMEGVKIEGGVEAAPTIARLVEAGVPVMGHIASSRSRFTPRGATASRAATRPAPSACCATPTHLEEAGAFSIVLEGIPLRCRGTHHQ